MKFHPLSGDITARIDALEADDDFVSPPQRSITMNGMDIGLLLSLAHERATELYDAGEDHGNQAVQLVAVAVMSVTEGGES